MTVVGAAFGAVGDSADELVGISDDLALALEGLADGSLVELYFTFAVGFLAIAAGLAPRAAAAIGWSALLLSLVLGQVGALLDLPEAVLDISPLTHVPAVPAEAWSWPPLVALLTVAWVLTVVGLFGWRRRDLVLAS